MRNHEKKSPIIFTDNPLLALVGNPNTGKSLVFNYLTQQYATVSNYPGTTVDISRGLGRFSGREFLIIDTPGTNSFIVNSEDEAVTRKLIISETPSLIIQVIDSKALRRSLSLAQELADLEVPLILDLNMSDEAKERGIKIDAPRLSQELNARVVETVATTRQGLEALKNSVAETDKPPARTFYGEKIEAAIGYISRLLPQSLRFKRFICLLIISGEQEIYKLLPINKEIIRRIEDKAGQLQKEYANSLRLVLQRIRENRAKEITQQVVSRQGLIIKKRWQEMINKLTLKPLSAVPLALLLLYLMYKFVGGFAAQNAVGFLEERIFAGYLIPWLQGFFSLVNLPAVVYDFILGEYGMFTMAITYALAIIFPILVAFFIFFGILEDSGYLPRLCALLDRLFHPLGLNGKAVLPFVLGLGCDTMATLTTRTLDTKKERIIATLILTLAIPCSAQLGVILGILGAISARATLIWLGMVIGSGILVSFLASRLIKGRRPALIQELPPIRVPQISNILLKVWIRLKWYLKEAVPLFILATAMLFFLDKSGALQAVQSLTSPLVTGLLSLPEKATEAFLVGFLRRDYGAAGLYMLLKSGAMDNLQAVVSLVVITLFVPCIAQFFVTIKERGLKIALLIFFFTFSFAFVAGGALNFVLRHFNVSF